MALAKRMHTLCAPVVGARLVAAMAATANGPIAEFACAETDDPSRQGEIRMTISLEVVA